MEDCPLSQNLSLLAADLRIQSSYVSQFLIINLFMHTTCHSPCSVRPWLIQRAPRDREVLLLLTLVFPELDVVPGIWHGLGDSE